MGNTVPDKLIHPTVKYEGHCPRYIHAGRQKLPSHLTLWKTLLPIMFQDRNINVPKNA